MGFPQPEEFNRHSDAQAIIDVAIEAATPTDLNPEIPQAYVVPAGARVEIPNLDAWRTRPTRTTGVYKFDAVDSLIQYVARLGSDRTTVWVDYQGKVAAVIDDASDGTPGWGQHRAELKLEKTPEWDHWLGLDGMMVSQERFAEHIDQGLDEIVEPAAADMLEIAQSFHATTDANFRSSLRLASGEQQLQYDETVAASAGQSGALQVPTTFLLALAPFVADDQPYKVAARLRFRLSSGKLTLGYVLDKPHRVQRDAIDGIVEKLSEKFPNTYVGSPAPLK